jgi:hypothetical protein
LHRRDLRLVLPDELSKVAMRELAKVTNFAEYWVDRIRVWESNRAADGVAGKCRQA